MMAGLRTALLTLIPFAQDLDPREGNHLWPIIICALFTILSYLLLSRILAGSTLTIAMGDSNGTANTPPAASATTDSSAPKDICNGDIKVSRDPPTNKELERCAELPVLDVYNKPHTFKSLYSGERAARRVLVLFIRHFFCGVGITELKR